MFFTSGRQSSRVLSHLIETFHLIFEILKLVTVKWLEKLEI